MKGKPEFTYMKDKKIAVYKSITTKTRVGQSITTWQPLVNKKLWAHYRSLSGSEFYNSAYSGFKEECCFTVNWRSDITAGLHIVYKGKVFEVIRVDDFEGYKKDIRLTCKSLAVTKLPDYPEIQ